MQQIKKRKVTFLGDFEKRKNVKVMTCKVLETTQFLFCKCKY